MIKYESFTLKNGLHTIVYPQKDTGVVGVNIMYGVGSRDEDPNMTGFAHLFEHLMFGGSKNAPNYDSYVERVGGNNNAYTTTDLTNYYSILPKQNIETLMWLESDRMLELSFEEKVLETQKKVVIEEYKENYLSRPYGKWWIEVCKLAYNKHPYRWPTIGRDMKHIENATMKNVKDFFYSHYRPNNAVMVIAGDVKPSEVETMVTKWFDDIPTGKIPTRNLPQEPKQKEARHIDLKGDVPLDSLFIAFHMGPRKSKEYYSADLLCNILGVGKSSRMYDRLVKEKSLCSVAECYITGSFDPGLFIIHTKLNDGVKFDEVEKEIFDIIDDLSNNLVDTHELQKVKNQTFSHIAFSNLDILNVAQDLALGHTLGNEDMVNEEPKLFQNVSREDIQSTAQSILRRENSNTIYFSKK